ncbi:MAG: hypothetical protein AB7P76_10945 [Candidatus Melainabacteria bacterium]
MAFDRQKLYLLFLKYTSYLINTAIIVVVLGAVALYVMTLVEAAKY